MQYDEDVADAESLDREEDYDDDYDEDEDEEEEYLFGTIPRTPGLIAFAAIGVVILLLLAALVSSNFGFVSGIDGLTVYIPGEEGGQLDEKLEIRAYTDTPAFGKNADGTGDLRIYWDNGESEIEVYTADFKFVDGRGGRTIPYTEFYVDNGEYRAEVTFEGETEFDTIELKRTAHHMIIVQKDHVMYGQENPEKVRYKISLFPDDVSTQSYDLLFTPGEGYIWAYYVENEADQDDEEKWEKVMNITFTTDFRNFEYQFPGEDPENLTSEQGYLIDFDAQILLDAKEVDEGYFSLKVFYKNNYGLVEQGAFTQQISAMPEDNPKNDPSESFEWVKLGDEDDE